MLKKADQVPGYISIEEAETNNSNKSKQIHKTIRYVLY